MKKICRNKIYYLDKNIKLEYFSQNGGRVYAIDAKGISEEILGANFPNTPMLSAVVKVSGILEEKKFVEDMENSYKHKFANKPYVIPKNMEALKRSLQKVNGIE